MILLSPVLYNLQLSSMQNQQSINIQEDTLAVLSPEKFFNFKLNTKLNLNHPDQIRSYYQNFQCTVCYDTPLKPVRCQKCKQIYCLPCVASQKQQKNICAFRCKGNFIIEKCLQFSPTFQCPCSQLCSQEIFSDKDFIDHCISCKFSTNQIKDLLLNKKNFKCRKGLHSLQFYIGTYDEMLKSNNCSICGQKRLWRTCCRICDEKFCLKCRPLIVDKNQCPIGHKLQKRIIETMGYLCDFCSLPINIVDNYLYDDTMCNFGICGLCYDDLPQKKEEMEVLVNEHEYCLNSNPKNENREKHRLKLLKIEKDTKCNFCQLVRKCPQQCQKCQQNYCLNCKPFLAHSKRLCYNMHRIIKKDNSLKVSCEKCLKVQQCIYEDSECNIKLCLQCLSYGICIISERIRPFFNVSCLNNHCLRFHSEIKQYIGNCGKCTKSMPIKFFCSQCQYDQYYCCDCYSFLDKEKCHQGHKLSKISGQKYMEYLEDYCSENPQYQYFVCHICSKDIKDKQMVGCEICSLNICNKCVEQKNQGKKTNGQVPVIESSESEFENLGY